MKKVFILNVPPRQGKDYLAKWLFNNKGFHHHEFKAALFDIALEVAYNVSWDEWWNRYETNDKELPWDKLGGLSQRQFLIKISEEWVKPVFGKDYFGLRAAKSAEISGSDLIVYSDGGFESEIVPLAERFGYNNVIICQWGKDNPDAFKNDSRNWITGFKTLTLPDNDFTPQWVDKCWEVISKEIG